MESPRNFTLLSTDGQDGSSGDILRLTPAAPTSCLADPVRHAIGRTNSWLLGEQHSDGHWVAELEGDSILESETILLLAFLGEEDSHLAHQAAERLLESQRPEGGWSMHPEGGVEVSGSVKAYFALKLTGHAPSTEPMQRARRAILAHGGADAVNSFTRFYLAMLGQIPYSQCPEVPPEAVLLPQWFPINLYAVSAWSRTILVPLSIVSALRPVRSLGSDLGIRELFLEAPDDWPPLRCPGLEGRTGVFSWDRFFRLMDRALKTCRQMRFLPLRRWALRAATRWMLERFEGSDGLGAIFPPIVWSLVALRALGYDDQSPEVFECRRQLDALIVEKGPDEPIKIQPCKSPVWDTAIALRALLSGGVQPTHSAIRQGVEWLLDKQVTRQGDWSKTVKVEPGGWCFEYQNDFYPDVDDTAMVLMALGGQFDEVSRPAPREPGECEWVARTTAAVDRGLRWMLAMQNDDGGWGAFDRNNNRQFLCHVPFADHNAMIDPSTPDLTGRALEALGQLGRRLGDRAVDRGVGYLRKTQEPDGSWFGRWGVNSIYGTWQALAGLAGVGVATDDPAIVAGAHWLLAYQQPCGAWGESPESYDDPTLRGQGPPTASQTAWAILGLLAAGMGDDPGVVRGIRFLVANQQPDGTWDEPEFTGTGFPRVFYLRYHAYPVYFPLLALSRWTATAPASLAEAAFAPLRVVRPPRHPHLPIAAAMR